ncbi:hypothetical protein PISMIDRAFT_683281 [Pisolithus microcarpus 441]|uniref:Uncharacterized protein n=1 Tax=Pisolithus microcarpus 441 TaxID=765257 RepID=A0A0C9YRM6_9AGAM|nr:hypothetical protein PISMIDRAFT_683281 [Pisolithus microcarpus 441]
MEAAKTEPSNHGGYESKPVALHRAKRHDRVIDASKSILHENSPSTLRPSVCTSCMKLTAEHDGFAELCKNSLLHLRRW